MKYTGEHPAVLIKHAPTYLVVPDSDHEEFYHHCYEHGGKVLPSDLEMYGYRRTARYINVTRGYKLFELLFMNSSQQARYCFLSPDHRMHGVIIPNRFSEHKAAFYSARDQKRKSALARAEEKIMRVLFEAGKIACIPAR